MRVGKLVDGIVNKVIESLLSEGSEVVDDIVKKIKESGIVDDILEEILDSDFVEDVVERVIEEIIEALTGRKVDIELGEDEDIELNLSDKNLPRTDDLDDNELGIF
tara:strand:- start:1493 stop:1810 length:318 start_codon:yes stop_codon:yes gene_type:complete